MASPTNQLFNVKTIKRLCDDVQLTQQQKDAAKEWISHLDQNKLEEEKKNYFRFGQIILQDILGYSIKDIDFDSDNVEFLFSNSQGKKTLCFEAKGTSTKDLFAPQHRAKKEHETPIKQTWDYIGNIGLDYGICTNYKDFVLITKDRGYSKYHKFDFLSIKSDVEKLKEFVGIFSKERIIDKGFVKKLHEESITEEREFTNEFYKLFHETRLMLIKEFSSNPEVTKEEAIHYAQLFLNRLIFMFFAEDNQLIPERIFTKRIQEVLNSTLISEHSKLVSDEILGFFQALNKGSHRLNIFGFNGGLFEVQIPARIYFSDLKDSSFFNDVKQNSKLPKKVKPNETLQKIIKQYGNDLNPIITNLLIMDSYDFTSEVNVNILGHIFEQSISDLEELRGEGISKRKREGVYYTPEYITDYICRNTIIPYLSKDHASTAYELVEEYADNLDELEKKFKEIKILDPACGSGAFLIKTVDILLEIHREIQLVKESRGKYSAGEQFSLAKWSEETEIQQLIENNIFGVDINEESVEITKLSLFLKLATENRKLIDLSQNIKVGNSLIDDPKVTQKAFKWDYHFKEIIENGGFDIVIGNPPYFNIETLGVDSPYANAIKAAYPEIWMDKSDILFYFVAKAMQLSKKVVGFIISNAFLFSEKAQNLRNHILENAPLTKIVNFERYRVFKDADITTALVFLDKEKKDFTCKALTLPRSDYEEGNLSQIIKNEKLYFDVQLKKDSVFALVNKKIDAINSKIDKAGTRLELLFKVGSGMQTGLNEVFIFNKYPKQFPQKVIKKRITGDIIERYHIADELEYCLYIEDYDKFDELPTEVQKFLLENKTQLESRADKKRRKTAKWWNYTFAMHKELYHLDKIWCSYRSKENCFVYDDAKGYIGLTNTTVIFGTNDKISLKYVLALLNSRLLSFRYKSIGKQTGEGLYEYFENGISKLPIPEIEQQKQKPFVEKVEKLIELYNQYYDKYNKFLKRLSENYHIENISKILKNFYELTFDQFYDILVKQKVILSYEKQEELEDYFKDRKKNCLK